MQKRKSLLDIFNEALQMLPPAGAGECAAPKLLQYAYQEGLTLFAWLNFGGEPLLLPKSENTNSITRPVVENVSPY